jgi:selT/selW/selH-like putative selenoprotein
LKSIGIPAEDIPGSKGQFDVVRDGELVFSKQASGRFPDRDEIIALLRD